MKDAFCESCFRSPRNSWHPYSLFFFSIKNLMWILCHLVIMRLENYQRPLLVTNFQFLFSGNCIYFVCGMSPEKENRWISPTVLGGFAFFLLFFNDLIVRQRSRRRIWRKWLIKCTLMSRLMENQLVCPVFSNEFSMLIFILECELKAMLYHISFWIPYTLEGLCSFQMSIINGHEMSKWDFC